MPNQKCARRTGTIQQALGRQENAVTLTEAPAPAPTDPAATAITTAAQTFGTARVTAAAPVTAEAPQVNAVRQTGLLQPQGPRKRTATPVRDHPAWKCVRIVADESESQPTVQCLGCSKVPFKAGAGRIADHLFGNGGTAACNMSCADANFRANRLKVQEKIVGFAEQKQRKLAIAAVNAATSSSVIAGSPATRDTKQPELNFHPATKAAVHSAIGRFFYAYNIPVSRTNSNRRFIYIG